MTSSTICIGLCKNVPVILCEADSNNCKFPKTKTREIPFWRDSGLLCCNRINEWRSIILEGKLGQLKFERDDETTCSEVWIKEKPEDNYINDKTFFLVKFNFYQITIKRFKTFFLRIQKCLSHQLHHFSIHVSAQRLRMRPS